MKRQIEIVADFDTSTVILNSSAALLPGNFRIINHEHHSSLQVATSLLVDATDSVEYVKGCVEEKLGILSDNQVLSSGVEILEDEALFGFYVIQEGDTVNLSLKNNGGNCHFKEKSTLTSLALSDDHTASIILSEANPEEEVYFDVLGDIHTGIHIANSIGMELSTINVMWFNDGSTFLDRPMLGILVKPTVRIRCIKCLIEQKTHIPADHQNLAFAGQFLEDSQLLISYDIDIGSTLNLSLNSDAINRSNGNYLRAMRDRPDSEQESYQYREFRDSASRNVPKNRAKEKVCHVFRKGRVSTRRDWAKWNASREDVDRAVLEVHVVSDGEEEH